MFGGDIFSKKYGTLRMKELCNQLTQIEILNVNRVCWRYLHSIPSRKGHCQKSIRSFMAVQRNFLEGLEMNLF